MSSFQDKMKIIRTCKVRVTFGKRGTGRPCPRTTIWKCWRLFVCKPVFHCWIMICTSNCGNDARSRMRRKFQLRVFQWGQIFTRPEHQFWSDENRGERNYTGWIFLSLCKLFLKQFFCRLKVEVPLVVGIIENDTENMDSNFVHLVHTKGHLWKDIVFTTLASYHERRRFVPRPYVVRITTTTTTKSRHFLEVSCSSEVLK